MSTGTVVGTRHVPVGSLARLSYGFEHGRLEPLLERVEILRLQPPHFRKGGRPRSQQQLEEVVKIVRLDFGSAQQITP